MNKIVAIIAISFLSASCSVGPDYHKPLGFTDNQIAQNLNLKTDSSRHISPLWYKDFNCSDLDNLIEEALKNSPNIKIALEKMHQARYRLFISRAGFLPSVDAQGSYNKNNQNPVGAFPIKSEYYQVGVDASWELDIWGGRRRLTESAKAMLAAAAADFDNVKISLIAEIASQYINWRLAEIQIEITQKNLNLQQEIFEIVNAQYKSGLTDDLAYEQAKSVLNATQMQLPLLRQKEKSYQNALAVLIGKLPDDIVKNNNELLNRPFSFDLNSLYDLPIDVIRNRPDVYVAERQLAAENALIGQTIANLFPSISLSNFLGYQNKTLAPIFAPDYNMYTVGALINLPLLHWGELINQVNLQESVTKQSFALYQASLLTAITDINNAIRAVEEEIKRNQLAAKTQKSNTEILDLSMQKYQNGLIDFSDVLTAEQNKLKADQEYLQSNADLYLNVIRFYKAVGGGLAINHRNNQACRTDVKATAYVHDKD